MAACSRAILASPAYGPVAVIVTISPRSSATRTTPEATAAKYGSAMSPTTSATTLLVPRATACACTFAL